ncbi:hypothetical protein RUS47_03745 [Mycoplasmoides gallisepticum]|uniref:hypothetical protein n=1 Tax=Mycoplasmoides gallisepticum TaxID=2096 RepID=UPI0012454BAD|nr:hypothetical protein [Mycoplasmoides gallisepticum]QEX47624.1 hypothetical protein F6J63_03805 [Mycoplasmoides gallisepticum]ULH62225.1 hypothetical protein MHC98_03775 [Mycoplasmoides gallisepticum]ULH67565.1 hypothetical protein MHC97_03750 [Mycoplasmoides gallisepticum]ULH68293.1 hypothetical protein MHC99_03775 [Mycoplasmoides gallisepticum]WGG23926.1 hypothetical protein P0D30_03980 [Mycoplasmoides gallisepticum]
MKKLSKGKIAVITTTALAVATTAIITPVVFASKKNAIDSKQSSQNAAKENKNDSNSSINGSNSSSDSSVKNNDLSFLPFLDEENAKDSKNVIIVDDETSVSSSNGITSEDESAPINGNQPINPVDSINTSMPNIKDKEVSGNIDKPNLAVIIGSTVGAVLGASLAGISVLGYNWKNSSNRWTVPTAIDLQTRPNEVELTSIPLDSPSSNKSLLTQGRQLKDLVIDFKKENKQRNYLLPLDWFASMNDGFNTGIINPDFGDFVKFLNENPEQKDNKLAFFNYLDKNNNKVKHFQSNLKSTDQLIEEAFSFLDDESVSSTNSSPRNSVRLPNLSAVTNEENNVGIRAAKDVRKPTDDPLTALGASYEQYLSQKIDNPNKPVVLTSSNHLEDSANELVESYVKYSTKSKNGTLDSASSEELIKNYYKFISTGKDKKADNNDVALPKLSANLDLDKVYDELKGNTLISSTNKIDKISDKIKKALIWENPVLSTPNQGSFKNLDILNGFVNGDDEIESASYAKVPRDRHGKPIISKPFNQVAGTFVKNNPGALEKGYIYITTTRGNNQTSKREARSFFIPVVLLDKKNKDYFENSLKLIWNDPWAKDNPYIFIQKFDQIKKENPNKHVIPHYSINNEGDLTYATLSFENTFKDGKIRDQLKRSLSANDVDKVIYSSISFNSNGVNSRVLNTQKTTVQSASRSLLKISSDSERRNKELSSPIIVNGMNENSKIDSTRERTIIEDFSKLNSRTIKTKKPLNIKGSFSSNSSSNENTIRVGILDWIRKRVSNFFSSTANFFRTRFAFLRR